MTSTDLEALPLSILESICEYLAHCDSRRRSLFAFSLASRSCYFAATSQIFERIIIKIQGAEKLYQDLEQWNGMLQINNHARHVRRVKIVGDMQTAVPGTAKEENDEPYTDEDWIVDNGSYEDGFYDPHPPNEIDEFDGSGPLPVSEERKRHNEAWLPLAQFVDKLSGLKELVYACNDQIQPCFLSALHRHSRNIRLYVDTFSLRSLYQPLGHPTDIDPDEFAIATSPCLYNITAHFYTYDTYGNLDYNKEAVMEMVAGSAPSLRHVRMFMHSAGDSLELREVFRQPRPPWRGFFASNEPPGFSNSSGRLESLILDGCGSTDSSDLITWSNLTDFSKLRFLGIHHGIRLDGIQTLTQLAKDNIFNGLRKLVLSIGNFTHHQQEAHSDGATSLLLRALKPLQCLKLQGLIGEGTFKAALTAHGPMLRHFRFIPDRRYRMTVNPYVISHSHVQELQRSCPNLQELDLLVPRTKGDGREASIYRTLGTMPRLKRVSLLLDCSLRSLEGGVSGGSTSREEQRASRARDCLVNTAIDSALARSIFNTIRLANGSAESPIKYLRLEVAYERAFDRESMELGLEYGIVRVVGRGWVCRRDARYGHGDEVIMKEVAKQDRIIEGEMLDEYFEESPFKAIWQSIWPATTGDWRESWSSLPLHGVSG